MHTTRLVIRSEFEEDLCNMFAAMDQPTVNGINTCFAAKAMRDGAQKALDSSTVVAVETASQMVDFACDGADERLASTAAPEPAPATLDTNALEEAKAQSPQVGLG